MKRAALILVGAVVLLSLAGCGGGDDGAGSSTGTVATTDRPTTTLRFDVAEGKRLVYDFTMGLAVEDVHVEGAGPDVTDADLTAMRNQLASIGELPATGTQTLEVEDVAPDGTRTVAMSMATTMTLPDSKGPLAYEVRAVQTIAPDGTIAVTDFAMDTDELPPDARAVIEGSRASLEQTFRQQSFGVYGVPFAVGQTRASVFESEFEVPNPAGESRKLVMKMNYRTTYEGPDGDTHRFRQETQIDPTSFESPVGGDGTLTFRITAGTGTNGITLRGDGALVRWRTDGAIPVEIEASGAGNTLRMGFTMRMKMAATPRS